MHPILPRKAIVFTSPPAPPKRLKIEALGTALGAPGAQICKVYLIGSNKETLEGHPRCSEAQSAKNAKCNKVRKEYNMQFLKLSGTSRNRKSLNTFCLQQKLVSPYFVKAGSKVSTEKQSDVPIIFPENRRRVAMLKTN